MKKTFYLAGLSVLVLGQAMADTVTIDLNGTDSLPSTQYRDCANDTFAVAGTNGSFTIDVAEVNTWLNGAATGVWYGTVANGHTGANGGFDSITTWTSATPLAAAGDNDLTVTFFNRKAYGGSVVGTVLDLGESCSDITSFTLTVDGSALGSTDNTPMTIGLVYQTGDSWTLKSLTGAASAWSGSTSALNIDLGQETLSSQTIYLIAAATGNQAGNASVASEKTLRLSLSAEVVPEPATATLSLLALAGLAARRRRK